MFTGIVEALGEIVKIEETGSNRRFIVQAPFLQELKIDQSVSHDGICLTVDAVMPDAYSVTAISETLSKTNLNSKQKGMFFNLERCMLMNGRIDGHIVQGHVDCTGICNKIVEKNGSWEIRIGFERQFAHHLIEKGSVTLNGISLTTFNVSEDEFTVAIIPYTYSHTNIQNLQTGDIVNLEFDMIGKYVARYLELNQK